ncbi:RapGAP/RanGAP domain-containing protein [Tieghemostelium lacteum]|uniref:RapGAP/RanGAP domain-containing protein n=1 Tax=Tieghemostelium lacteum TaxID=361077 RepID=A0A152A9R4_TIELA|nr:RapGAP/RanGAP domain-containing protein [Tieghemostelium lacteum]|eukprot:KYR02963.1 RapGAP/RanGAP domain-containing protein [Tieghemostelium lacteum]
MIFYDCRAIINMITREEDCQNETNKIINDANKFFQIINVYLQAHLYPDGSVQVHNQPQKLEAKKFQLHCLITSCNSMRSFLNKFVQSSKCIDVGTNSTIYNLVKNNLNSMIPLLAESSRKIIKVLKDDINNQQSEDMIMTISSKFVTQMKALTEYCCDPVTLNRDTFEYMKSQYMSTWQQFLNLLNECLLDIGNEIITLTKTVLQLADDLGMIFQLTLRSYSHPTVQIEALQMRADIDKCIQEICGTIKVVFPLLTQSIKRQINAETLPYSIPLISHGDELDGADTDDHHSLGSGGGSNRSSIISIDNSIKHSSSNLESYLSTSAGMYQPSSSKQPTRIDSIPKSSSLNEMSSSGQTKPLDNGQTNNKSWGDMPIIVSLDSDDEDDQENLIWSMAISTVSNDPFQKNKTEEKKDTVNGSEKKKKWYHKIISNGKPSTTAPNAPATNSNPTITVGNQLTPTPITSHKKTPSTTSLVNSFNSNISSTSTTPSYSSPISSSRPSTPSVEQLITTTSQALAIPNPTVEISILTTSPSLLSAGNGGSQRIIKNDSFLNLASQGNSITHIGDGDDDDDYETSIDLNDTPIGFRGSVQDPNVQLFETNQKDFTIEDIGDRSKRFKSDSRVLGNGQQKITIGFENNERHITHYESHFYGQDHFNFVGLIPELGGNVIVSIKKEVDNLVGDKRHRTLIITKNSTEKILLKSSSSKEGDLQKAILQYLKPIVKLSSSSLKSVKTESLQTKILQFEKNNCKKQYHYFLMFAADIQSNCTQMLNNDNVSKEFTDFHRFLGKTFQTKNWNKYSGGLDINHNLDASTAVYTEINDIEIVFHVSSMMMSHRRKEFLSKNTTVIVYHEGSKPLNLSTFDQNNQIFFEIRKVKYDDGSNIYYKLGTSYNQNISPFGPMIPDPPIFKKDLYFKQYLLTKLINATNSSLLCNHINKDLVKTREIELNNIISRRPTSTH